MPTYIYKSTASEKIIFHYNKGHNADTSIPPWVIKVHGQVYYINHITSNIGFSTKETPLSETTKGAIKFFGYCNITDDGSASVTGERLD
jgi:hypothetical protein